MQNDRTTMKYVIIIPDGCADEPQEALDGKTPLQAARIPAMDEVARLGIVGAANNVPLHLIPGSDVANMNLLGYDVDQYFSGRAPLEAAAQGIQLGSDDWAIRCNLVTIQSQVMRDFTAGHISTEEARALLADLQREVADLPQLEFVPGVSYRNLLLYRPGAEAAPFTRDTRGTPPHDLTDKSVVDDYPRGPGSDLLSDLMQRSVKLFAEHKVNVQRVKQNQLPATNVWLWGMGRAPALPAFADRFGLRGRMITAVDLLRGLARLIGWECVEVEGATGYLDTNYAGKGAAAIEALDGCDIVCVHVEATDEASHEGRVDAKIAALESIDQQIVAPVHAHLRQRGDYRLLISPDHPTFIRTKTHSHGDVPWTICGAGIDADAAATYDETTAAGSPRRFDPGHELMPYFLTLKTGP